MDPIRKIPKKFTKKFGNNVINRQYFCRKTGLEGVSRWKPNGYNLSSNFCYAWSQFGKMLIELENCFIISGWKLSKPNMV